MKNLTKRVIAIAFVAMMVIISAGIGSVVVADQYQKSPDDILISTAIDTQFCPTVAYNSANNEYLVTWYDYRRNSEEPDIYAQRVSGADHLIGGNFPIAISGGTDIKEVNPFVAYNPTNNEYLVVWNEKWGYHNLYYIYAQRLSNTGSLLGSKITISSGDVRVRKFHPAVTYNPDTSEYLVVWYGQSVERDPYRVYGQRLSSSGFLLGSNFAIGEYIGEDNFQYLPQITHNSHSNEYLVVWEDMRNNGEKDIYAQKVSGSGSLLGSNFCISSATSWQEVPSVAYNFDDNQFLVTWQDKRNDNGDIYARRVSGTGSLLGNEIAVRVGSETSLNPSVTYNSDSNVYFIAWEEDGDIFAQAISSDGELSGSSFVICDATGSQSQASVVYNSINTRYFVTWHDYRNGNYDIYGNSVHAIPEPTVSIYTDKTSYTTGDTMHVGLNVTNPSDAQDVRFAIWLKKPDGGIKVVTDRSLTLPAGLDYSNPDFMVFTLPGLPSGTYTWNAALIEPSGPVVFISHDTAEWEFVPPVAGSPTEDIAGVLGQTAVFKDFDE